MKLSSFKASPTEYDLNLDYYHGKDVVHEGCLLILDPAKAWPKLSSQVRNKLKKSLKNSSISIKRAKGTTKDIQKFRTIWFDPYDETLPKKTKY